MGAEPQARLIAEAARRLVRRLDELGRVSDEKGRLTRTFLSPAMRRANAVVAGWMRQAGLAVSEDRFGNLVGRTGGPRRTLLIGSHLDTVRDAGRFDGALGVLTGIAAVEALGAACLRELPFSLAVAGFAEEEGVRFSSAYLGSKGFFGRLSATELARRDQQGRSVREVLATYLPRWQGAAARTGAAWAGYLEVHIEQGPVLEKEGVPLGVVSAIAGQTRGVAVFTGRAGHAGTTPMALRRDALAGAAEWIGRVERRARLGRGLVATVGRIEAEPGAPNVIPGEVSATLDLRHARDALRRRALSDLLREGRAVARRRGLRFRFTATQENDAVACDPRLTRLLAKAAGFSCGRPSVPVLVSGAGHDAVIAAQATPAAMLFVRCRGGVSHHPEEFALPSDIAAALRATCDFVRRLALRP